MHSDESWVGTQAPLKEPIQAMRLIIFLMPAPHPLRQTPKGPARQHKGLWNWLADQPDGRSANILLLKREAKVCVRVRVCACVRGGDW